MDFTVGLLPTSLKKENLCYTRPNDGLKRKSQLHPAKRRISKWTVSYSAVSLSSVSISTALRPELTDFELTDTLYAASCAPLRLWSHNTDCGDGDCLLSRPTSYPVMPESGSRPNRARLSLSSQPSALWQMAGGGPRRQTEPGSIRPASVDARLILTN